MKITDLIKTCPTVLITEFTPGTGFQSNLKEECKKNDINFICITANEYLYPNPKLVVINEEKTVLMKKEIVFPSKSPKLIVIEEFELLDEKEKVAFIKKVNNIASNFDTGVIIPVIDVSKISPEVLKESTYLGNSKNLPPVGPGNVLTDMIEYTRKVDLTEIRKKYNSFDTNKNTPK